MDFIQITSIDIIDIVLVAVIMYQIYKLTKGTNAPSILTGILLIYLLWVAVKALHMELMTAIMNAVIGVGVIALIVVFQPEIRRFLHLLGTRGNRSGNSFFGRLFEMEERNRSTKLEYVSPIVQACSDISEASMGALIVVRGESDLAVIAETGVPVDAKLTSMLLKNIFFRNSPLHDGAVIVHGGRVVAAKCILPSTTSDVPLSFGMRHRAAIGLSEMSDAVIVVVSEETGAISVVRQGEVKVGLSPAELQAELLKTEKTG